MLKITELLQYYSNPQHAMSNLETKSECILYKVG